MPEPFSQDHLKPGQCFPTTKWTQLLDPIRKQEEGSKEALERWCLSYWGPIYAYLRRRGFEHHEAEDLTQGFVASLIERNSFIHLNRERGKFRCFLIACLKNFISSEIATRHSQKRGGRIPHVPIEEGVLLATEERDAETAFDLRWASDLVNAAIEGLKLEFDSANKSAIFSDLKDFLPGGSLQGSKEELAKKLGMSPNNLDVTISRFRQRYGSVLRKMIEETVCQRRNGNGVKGAV